MKKRWCLGVFFFLLTSILASKGLAQDTGVIIGLGINVSSHIYNLGDAIQTTPCHPGDMSDCKGPIEAGLNTASSNDPRIRLGFFYKHYRIGFEARWQALGAVDDYRKGIYETNSYPLPSPYESYAFTRLIYDPFLYMPFVGFEHRINELTVIYFDLGIPFTKVTASSGWDRYGEFQEYQKETQDIWGYNIGVGIHYALYEVSIRYESFGTEFADQRATLSSIQINFGYELMLPLN